MKCKDCINGVEDAVTGYFGNGLYWVTGCNYLPERQKLVDADVERECEHFKAGVSEQSYGRALLTKQ